MKRRQKVLFLLLALAVVLGLTPCGGTTARAAAADAGITITQTAQWEQSIPGSTVVNVTLRVTSPMDLQTPKDVVFVIDHAASQDVTYWKSEVKRLADMLAVVPGMRYALVAYSSAAETLLDFTTDVSQLEAKVNTLQKSLNSNLYDGLRQAKSLIDRRSDTSNKACIVVFSNGRFNLNLAQTSALARELRAVLPVYGIATSSPYSSNVRAVCSELLDVKGIAMQIGESRIYSGVTVTGQLDTGNFTGTGTVGENGVFTRRIPGFQAGQFYTFSFSGVLKDRQQTGSISAALEASITGDGFPEQTAAPVSLTRSALRVFYNASGGQGSVPVDEGRYISGDTVAVKPSSLWKQGWNFSGWTHPTLNLQKGSFSIAANTTLNASWGRAFVKLSSSTVETKIKGTHMLNQSGIWNKYGGGFYLKTYWDHLVSVNLHKSVEIPDDAVARWDITDTSRGDSEGAVMAWVVKNEDDPSKYDLHIGGRGGLTAPEDARNLFYGCTASVFNGLKNLDTSETKLMGNMFSMCPNVVSLDLSSWKTSNVTSMEKMFCAKPNNSPPIQTKLVSLNLSGWDTSNVTGQNGSGGMHGMFWNCQVLEELIGEESWNTSNVTTMESMFRGCRRLTTPDGTETSDEERNRKLNVEQWDTDEVTEMRWMFENCASLKSLDLSSWNTAQSSKQSGTNLRIDYIFSGCTGLEYLDVSTWRFPRSWSGKANMSLSHVFSGCSSLTELDVSQWQTGYVHDMTALFYNCKSLQSLDLSNWNMTNVLAMDEMLWGCVGLNSTSIGRTRIDICAGGTAYSAFRNVESNFSSTKVYAGGSGPIDTGQKPSTRSAVMPDSIPDVVAPEESTVEEEVLPEELPGEQEALPEVPEEPSVEQELPPEEPEDPPVEEEVPPEVPEEPGEKPDGADSFDAGGVVYAASAPDYDRLGDYGRPVYACKKVGLWDCGEVTAGQTIYYTLELQYLNDTDSSGGVSGQLTVTNPIPAGLTYNGDAAISSAYRIVAGDGGGVSGRIVSQPSVSGNVLTFTVSGLSAGARYTVTYSCTAPDPGPGGYTEFLNTASVTDNGLTDEADPVLHYMNDRPEELRTVTYSYADAPAGAQVPPAVSCTAGSQITLPAPVLAECVFKGWQRNGSGQVYSGGADYTVNSNTHFVGVWERVSQPRMVSINYQFDAAGPRPENAELIQQALLESAATEMPERGITAAPVLASPPEGYGFRWRYPRQLAVGEDGSFSVGLQSDWPGGTITIVGEWLCSEYPVTYQYGNAPAGAPELPGEQTYTWGSRVLLAPDPASTEDWLFLGWTGVEADESGSFEMPMRPLVLTGAWEERVADPEVKIDPNGGAWNGREEDAVLLLAEYEAQVAAGTFPDPQRPGMLFQGWREESDPAGVFAKIVTASWRSPGGAAHCTVTFNAQGGSPVASQTVDAGSRLARPADPTREGYVFEGWYREPEGITAWDFDRDFVTQDLVLYAKWEEKTYTVSGTVTDAAGNLLPGVLIRIVQGRQEFKRTTTDIDGQYTFEGVSSGIYNVVALYQGVTTTILSVVRDRDLSGQDIYMPSDNTNSTLVVEEETPNVVVGYLDQEAESVRGEAPGAQRVQVAMNVAQTDEAEQPREVQAVQAEARRRSSDAVVDLVLDVSVEMEIRYADHSVEEALHTTANILELVVPYDMTGKRDIRVHRYHDAGGDTEGAVTFEEISVRPTAADGSDRRDRTFYLNADDHLIHIFARKFSLYAVSYTPETPDTPVEPADPEPWYGDGRNRYVISASAGAGGTIRPTGNVSVAEGSDQTFSIVPAAGYAIRDVLVDGESVGPVSSYTFRNVRARHTIEALFVPEGAEGLLNTEEHLEYLHGFQDGSFRPDSSMTRGEAAQMFYNLLRDHDVPALPVFSDVPAGAWYADAVNTMCALGVMTGVGEGRFAPDRPITRAEFAATAVRLMGQSGAWDGGFPDVEQGDWFYPEVMTAAGRGWITGYGDGTFRPGAPISRAEAPTMVNRMLKRQGDLAYIQEHGGALRTFSDLTADCWAYCDIMEAANVHLYRREENEAERWTELWPQPAL